ncbi:Hypothetical predicted protein [Pelobates cultripes]|uniref:TRAF-type zinc finger domain-containing protein 1 n=1 Tax=Pelobates cultripes TaxID=61616 RepID=A0AAD1SB01_PELCU|nr:Hypothetical predicted protein [Pelobates cultripes]
MNMASASEQETRLCWNCKREIPSSNFTIHEIHCRRNISVCRLCKEPFPTSEMDEHMATEHAPVTCKCKKTMEKCDLEEHERNACPLRLVKCQFCDLELAFNKLGDHEDYCGARTECCEKCGRSVMTKDLSNHPQVCGKQAEPKRPTKSQTYVDYRDLDNDGAWFERSDLQNPLRDNVNSRARGTVPSRFYRNSSLPESMKTRLDKRGEQNRVSERTILSRSIPAKKPGEERAAVPSIPIRKQPGVDSFKSLSLQNDVLSSPEPDPVANYDFWKAVYSKSPPKNNAPQWQDSRNFLSNNETKWYDPGDYETDDIKLPCEFCEKLIPEHKLILHQSGCNSAAFASFCEGRTSPRPLQTSQQEKETDWLPEPPVQSKRSISPSLPLNNSQRVLIPCEFCGVPMEQDILFHHQDQCDLCPTSEHVSPFSSSSSSFLPIHKNSDREEAGVLEKLPSGLSLKGGTIQSHRNNLQKENLKQLNSLIESRPEGRKTFQTNTSRTRFSGQESNVTDTKTEEDNVRFGRNHHYGYPDSGFYRSLSTRNDFEFSTNANGFNPRNKPKAKKPNSVTGDVEKEE